MKQHYMVSEEQEDLRIDRYLSEACEELSRSYIQKLLKNQDVLVNGGPVKASYKVAAGDRSKWMCQWSRKLWRKRWI